MKDLGILPENAPGQSPPVGVAYARAKKGPPEDPGTPHLKRSP